MDSQPLTASFMLTNPVFVGRDFKAQDDLCFVLMPLHQPFLTIFDSHIKPAAETCNLHVLKADDIMSNKPVMEDVWKHINMAKVVIADLTARNPNVFYELGVAHTLGKEVIMITQDKGGKVPFDVGHVRYIKYSFPVRDDFDKKLKATILTVLKESKRLELLETKEPRRSSENKITPVKPRKQRISELVVWARENSDRLLLEVFEKQAKMYGYVPSSWSMGEMLKEAIMLEATKRWNPTSSTARNYADNAFLDLQAEFTPQFEKFVSESEEERIKEKERHERKILQVNIDTFVNSAPEPERSLRKKAVEVIYYLWNSMKRPEASEIFIHEITRSKQFTREIAVRMLDDMVRGKILQEVGPSVYKFLGTI